MLFLNVFQVVQRDYCARQQAAHLLKDNPITHNVSCEQNIYWIVCDAYTSRPILQKYYDFDNLPFYHQLEDLGFKILDKRISNCHPIAHYSTLKAINTYLNFSIFNAAQQDPLTLHYTLKKNPLCEQLSQHGYHLYAIVPRFTFLHYINAVKSIGPKVLTTMGHFCYICFKQNRLVGRFFVTKLNRWLFDRQNEIFTFLQKLPLKKEKKQFYYIHLDLPHAPFILDADGSFQDDQGSAIWGENEVGIHAYAKEAYQAGYCNQLQALNVKLLTAIKNIVQKDPDATIILQDTILRSRSKS